MGLLQALHMVVTFDCEPGSSAHSLRREDDGARVLHGEVRQGEAVDSPIGAHPPLVVGFHPDAVLLPRPLHICVGKLHLEGCCLPFKGFLVSEAFADGDFAGWI